MKRSILFRTTGVGMLLLAAVTFAAAQEAFAPVAEQVNRKMVKLFGAGGFKGLPSYGTGIVVSPQGHILTINNHILTTVDLRVHLADGRVLRAKVIAREPELDLALCKLEEDVKNLPYFDIAKEAARPLAEPGDWVLAFSNQFQIATRSEPMSVQRGVIAAYTELRGRRGDFDAPYQGDAYFIDAIANNPGAAGGIVTTRKGQLLGIIGRELKYKLSDTWINYAMPIQAKAEVIRDDKKDTVDVVEFVTKGIKGTYRQSAGKARDKDAPGAFSGIVLVPNAVSVTPPYVEEVLPKSPAAAAGLRPDDLIVYVDGELVPSIRQFRDVMKGVRPGTELVLEVQRGTKLQTVKLKLVDFPKGK